MSAIGTIRLTLMSTGGILGMSVFTLPATLHSAGIAGYLVWLLVTPAIICLSLMFAQLSMRYPGAGGPYGYVRAIFGKRVGRIAGYLYLLAMIVQQSAVLAFFGETVVTLTGTRHFVLACILPVLLCGAVNAIKLDVTATLSAILSTLKFAPIALLLFAHLPSLLTYLPTLLTISTLNAVASTPLTVDTLRQLTASLPVLLFAFSGFEFGTIASTDEIKNPQVTVPKAIAYSTILAGTAYFLMQCMVATHSDTISTIQQPDQVLYKVAENTFGTLFSQLLSCSKLVFAWYAVTFGIVFTGHLLSQMSKNHDLPRVFSEHSSAYKICIATSTVLPLVGLLAVTGSDYQGFSTYVAFIESCDVIFSIGFLLCTASYAQLYGTDILTVGSGLGSLVFLYASVNYASCVISATSCALLAATTYIARHAWHSHNIK